MEQATEEIVQRQTHHKTIWQEMLWKTENKQSDEMQCKMTVSWVILYISVKHKKVCVSKVSQVIDNGFMANVSLAEHSFQKVLSKLLVAV